MTLQYLSVRIKNVFANCRYTKQELPQTERIMQFLQHKWNTKRNLGRMVQGAGAGLVIFVDC